jgi:hypothetical protein
MSNILTGVGVIKYNPPRPGMKHRTDWWAVLDVNKELTRYYRWWLEFEQHIHLQPPSWDCHISIVRGEKPQPEFIDGWKKYQGERLEFTYTHGVIRVGRSLRTDARAENATGGEYYFIDVVCPRLDEIRKELGLKTGFNHHLTIGRTYEYLSKHENKPKR